MIDRLSVDVEGAKLLAENLRAIGEELAGEAVGEATLAGGEIVAAAARRNVQRKSGNTARAISTKLLDVTEGKRATLVGVQRVSISDPSRKTNVDRPASRAHLLEFGTSKVRAFPFIRPALDSTRTSVLNVMRSVLAQGIATLSKGEK